MQLVVDIHSHSGYSGGVGQISLGEVADTMHKKGINVFGTGDCMQPEWSRMLRGMLEEQEKGLFYLSGAEGRVAESRFLLQSEIIITADVPSGGRKGVHTVITFPSFSAAAEVTKLLEKWDTKIGMGRPFLKCEGADSVAERMHRILAVDASIMIIPAHVLTPQGIYGSDHPVESMADFYGDFASEIFAVETGLSADPEILALIPELDSRTFISNSDCHSAALNRVGREFTALDVDKPSYIDIVSAIKDRKVNYTAEFTPAEGRYFLTGHRPGKNGHGDNEFCYFSPDTVPDGNICPLCGKALTVGVLQRALDLSGIQGDSRTIETISCRQEFIQLVPLVEVIAAGLKVKNPASKKVLSVFETVISEVGSEETLWRIDSGDITKRLGSLVDNDVIDALLSVANKDFTFDPLGYDGTYGELVLGQKGEWFGHQVVCGRAEAQANLFSL